MNLADLFLLRPDITFLNHGSFGACPRPVFDQYQAWQQTLEHQPVEFLGRRFPTLMREARTALAQFVQAAPDELVYVTNATTGLNIVARSIPLQPGDEVLTTDHEYGAIDRTWQFMCQKQQAIYVRQPISLPIESANQVVESIWAAVTERTRVLFLSHITSSTAIIFPLAELIERARQANIITVIDGAHTLGQIPLNLSALGADFYASNCHKWLMAPKGAGFLYARSEMQSLLEPLIVSWGWQSRTPSGSRFVDEHEYQGTQDIAAYLTVPQAIEFQQTHDWLTVRDRCQALVRQARQQITALTNLPPLTPDERAWFVQMAAFALPPCDGETVKRRLYDEFKIEIPITYWRAQPFIRISIQGYNNTADVATLLEALTVILKS